MERFQKGYIATLIILIIAVAAVAGYYFYVHDQGQVAVSPNQEGCQIMPYTGTTQLNKLTDYINGVQDVRGGIICKYSINPALPEFTFHFVGGETNTLSKLEIMEGTSTKIVQTINESIPIYPESADVLQNIIVPVDANFDGYKDIPIATGCGATGNCSYDFFVYNPVKNIFTRDEFFSGLGTFGVDAVDKQITSSYNSSVADWEVDTYQFANGKYILIEKKTSTWNREDGADGSTATVRQYEFKSGQLRLVSSTTSALE